MAGVDLGGERNGVVASVALKRAIALLGVLTAVRLVLAAVVPLAPDETYYWEWSRHLAAGYFDHPPAIAWLIQAGTLVAGDTPLGVRLGSVLAGSGGLFVTVMLARRLGGDGAAWRAAVLLSAVPLVGIGLVLASPDTPQLLCSAVVLWAVDRAIEAEPGGTLRWWMLAGVALGFALTAKYAAVLLPLAIVVACVAGPALRVQFRRPGPYVAAAISAIIFLPVVVWNVDHDWISFRFQLHHGFGRVGDSALLRELALVGGQAGLASPILFGLAVCAVWHGLANRGRPRSFLLAVTAAFVWGFFAVSALRRPVEPNWPASALLPALVLLAAWSPSPRRLTWERIGIAVGAAVQVAAITQAIHPWMPIPARSDPMGRVYGWDELARAVSADVADSWRTGQAPQGGRIWIAADRYQDASELGFHLSGHPTVFSLNLGSRPNQFDLWPTARDSVRPGDALTVVLDDGTAEPGPVARLRPHFRRVEEGALIEMHTGAHVVGRRRLWHFLVLTDSW